MTKIIFTAAAIAIAIITQADSSELPKNLSPSPTPTISLPLPQQKTLYQGSHVFQTFNNCGPASLSMALSYYGVSVNQTELGQELRPFQHPQGNNDDKSVTLTELAAKAREYNLLAYHRPAGNIDIIKQFIANDMPVITRTLLEPNDDIGHYRIVKGFNDATKVIIQDDSLQGKNLTYSYTDFENLWQPFNYEYLILVPPDKQLVVEQILGSFSDETMAWTQALELAKKEGSLFNQSVALFHLGQYQESVNAFEKAAGTIPRRALWYQFEPLLAYYKIGNFDQALTIIDRILHDQNQAYSELYYLQGLIYEAKGDSRAQAAYDLAKYYNVSEYWHRNISL